MEPLPELNAGKLVSRAPHDEAGTPSAATRPRTERASRSRPSGTARGSVPPSSASPPTPTAASPTAEGLQRRPERLARGGSDVPLAHPWGRIAFAAVPFPVREARRRDRERAHRPGWSHAHRRLIACECASPRLLGRGRDPARSARAPRHGAPRWRAGQVPSCVAAGSACLPRASRAPQARQQRRRK